MARLFQKTTLCIVILSALSGGAYALTPGEDQGLNDLIREALSNNQDLAALEDSVNAVEKMAGFEGALSDPRFGVSFSNLPVSDLDFKTDPMSQKQFFIAQNFPWPGKRGLKAKTYSLEAGKLSRSLTAERLSLSRQITEVYYDLGYTSESLLLNDALASLFKKIIHSAASGYAAGRGLQQDIFQAEVELSKLADEKIALSKKYTILQNRLNALLGRESYLEVTPPKAPFAFDFDPDPEVLKQNVLEGNPRLQGLGLDIEKSRSQTLLAKKDYYPDIDVKFTYAVRDEDKTGRNLDDLVSLSATMALPLWKSKRQDNNVAAKKASEHAAVKKYTDLKLTLPRMAEILATEIKNAGERHRLYHDRLIPQAKQWAESALSDYEVGKIEFNTMVKARIQPLVLELKAKEYLFEMHKKKAELQELTGGITSN